MTIKSRGTKIPLALSSRRDNHHLAATVKMAFLVVAAFPSRLSRYTGLNRWESREFTVFPAKAWFRGSPWEGLIKTVLRLERTVCKRDPKTGLCRQTCETVFWVSSAAASDRSPTT
jgi:hypothetical protein